MNKLIPYLIDLASRLAPAAFCVYMLYRLLADFPRSALAVVSRVSVIIFFLLSFTLFLIRHRAIAKSSGVYVRVVAFMGASLFMLVPLTGSLVTNKALLMIGIAFTLAGNILAVISLYGLGRAFSIMPEARKLVITGPYRFCRHPLYASESLAILGVIMQYLSPMSILVFAVYAILQYGRIRAEEKVLASAFPGYRDYKASTPMLIPRA